MANFQDFSLVNSEISYISKKSGINEIPRAFINTFLEHYFPEIDAEDYITDGPSDKDIDAYYVDVAEEKIYIFQFKHAETFDGSKSKSFSPKDLKALIFTMGKIWNKDEEYFTSANNKVREAVKEIWDAIEKGFLDTEVYIVTNYINPINPSDAKTAKKEFQKEFRANFNTIGLDELVNRFCSKDKKAFDLELKLSARNYFDTTSGDIRALIGTVNAPQLLDQLIKEGVLEEEFFNENVRVYLKTKGKINKQIYNTATGEDAYKFFYYNNGITIICDSLDFTPSDSPVVKIKNFQIVNGSQTIHALFDAYREESNKTKIDDIYFLVRIYEVKNRDVGQNIARYTNSQNPVRSRDIMSNDPIQIKLEKELQRAGFYYERKRYQFRDNKEILNEKTVDAEKLGQIILAYYLERPGSSKNKKQEIFGEFYNDIFDDEKINASYALIPYMIYQQIDGKAKEIRAEKREFEKNKKIDKAEKLLENLDYILHAQYYILLATKMFFQKESIGPNLENVQEICRKYLPKATETVRALVKAQSKEAGIYLAPIFKSDAHVETLRNLIYKR